MRAAAVSILLSAGIGVAGAMSTGAVGPVGVAASQAQTSASVAEVPGVPILVVTEPDDSFGDYYAEILKTEGLNEFALTKATALTAETLARHQVVVLAANDALTSAQADLLMQWVRDGGKLIAMRPSAKLASEQVWAATRERLENGYLKIDTGTVAGAGLTGTTMQFHGAADRWSLAGASFPRDAVLRTPATPGSARRDRPQRRLRRRANGHVGLRSRPFGRLHAPGQPGLGRTGTRRRAGIDPVDDLF